MTVNVGWRSGDTVYLIADSAITHYDNGTPQQPTSAMGEAHASGARRVEEALAKVIQLSPNTVTAYAGNVHAALRAIHSLRSRLASGAILPDVLMTIAEEFEHSAVFRLLVAGVADGHAGLWIVDPMNAMGKGLIIENYEDLKPVVLGSLSDEGTEFIKTTIESVAALPQIFADPSVFLASIVTCLQARGQRARLMDEHVGGTFFGARVNSTGPIFQDDIVYVMFRRKQNDGGVTFEDYLHARSLVREGLSVAWSSADAERFRIFVTDVHEADARADAIGNALVAEFAGGPPYAAAAKHYAWIDRDTAANIYVHCPGGKPANFTLFADRTTMRADFFRRLVSLPFPVDGRKPQAVPFVFLTDASEP